MLSGDVKTIGSGAVDGGSNTAAVGTKTANTVATTHANSGNAVQIVGEAPANPYDLPAVDN